jgi:TfoX/Sxy family transcriptional regulator of competence genes
VSPEERFDEVVADLVRAAGVTPPGIGSGFGSGALRVHNKIFAMLVRGQLVVKLPRRRVDALVASGEGARFDANKGTPMKEWLALDPRSELGWSALAHEALEFVNR